ncbi:MAG: AAA family ATPase [Myxococcota bacterium]|nr:AAA family ATPase [Myxococcota bacterium]
MSDHMLYGAQLDADRTTQILQHLFENNLQSQEKGRSATPICIWGTHGIGKTMMVEEFAEARGWAFAYCAPAQFEEMGDLNGLPILEERDGEQVTRFAPPSWVPKTAGPGILLLDDINRADDRILRGLMQLLQKSEMFSWKLPEQWQIVCTANPEGGDYSVTPMDDAMLTRMLHVSMVFDAKSWARWASRNGVDERGIAFVLTYPESVTGRRTTPRSLTQFFQQIQSISDLKSSADLVYTLGMSSLDEVTVSTFMAFVNDNLKELVDPQEILETDDFASVAQRINLLAEGGKRMDHLSTICTRLYLAITHPDFVAHESYRDNLVDFLMLDTIPSDLRMTLHRDIAANCPDAVKRLVRDPRLAELILGGM